MIEGVIEAGMSRGNIRQPGLTIITLCYFFAEGIQKKPKTYIQVRSVHQRQKGVQHLINIGGVEETPSRISNIPHVRG